MKRIFQIPLGCTAALFSAVLASAPVAQAEVLNVNFAGGDGAATYTGQGALSDPGHDAWNNLAVPPGAHNFGSLVWSDGTAATDVTVQTTYTNPATLGPYGIGLFNGSINIGSGGGATVTIGGLTPGVAYDVYLYSAANYTFFGTLFSMNSVDSAKLGPSAGDNESITSFVENGNYVKFLNQTAVGGTLSIDVKRNTESYWVFNGLQVARVGAALPAATATLELTSGTNPSDWHASVTFTATVTGHG